MRSASRFASDLALSITVCAMRAFGQLPLTLRLQPYSEADSAARLLPSVESAPRMVWIGDAEPLDYPEISRYTNALAASGREVFLHTDGRLLRQRIHEFKPSSRLWFVFRFDATDAAGNDAVLEAIRVAKLSGFLTVGLTLLYAPAGLGELTRLHGRLRGLGLDGELILPAQSHAGVGGALMTAWRQLLPAPWRAISRMFVHLAVDAEGVFPGRAIRVPDSGESAPRECEEGAQA